MQDFLHTQQPDYQNEDKNRSKTLLPHKYSINDFISLLLLSTVDIADTARVILPQIDGDLDYINFCYINVIIKTIAIHCHLHSHTGLSSSQSIFGWIWTHAVNSW